MLLPRLQIFRAGLTIALLTILVGIGQILLDLLVARKFGASPTLDAFYLAFILPSTLVNVLAGGAVLGAFTPAYVQILLKAGATAARQIMGQAFMILVVWMISIAIILYWTYPALWKLAGEQYAASSRVASVELFSLLLPFLILNGTSSLLCVPLVAAKHYVLSSIAPAIVPFTAVVIFESIPTSMNVHTLALGLSFGAALQCALLLVILLRLNLISFRFVLADLARLRPTIKDYCWMFGTAGLLAGIAITDQVFAAGLEPGSVAKLTFGFKLINMFLALSTVAIANAFLPFFARAVVEDNRGTLWAELRDVLCAAFVVGVIAAVIWQLLSQHVVQFIYEGGAFTHSDTKAVGKIQSVYALHIPFYIVGTVSMRMLNAMRRNDLLMLVAIFAFVLNIVANFFFAPKLGVEGIALSKTIVFGFILVSLFLILRSHLDHKIVTARVKF